MLVYYIHLSVWKLVDITLRELWVLTNSTTLWNSYLQHDKYKPDWAWYASQGAQRYG